MSLICQNNLPEKSVRDANLRLWVEDRLPDVTNAANKQPVTERLSSIVVNREELIAKAAEAKETRGKAEAVGVLPLDDVREVLLAFEASLDTDEFYANKEAYVAGRESWIERVKAAATSMEMRQCLIDFQASIEPKYHHPWWKTDQEIWVATAQAAQTAGLLSLLFVWYRRALKRLPGDPFPPPVEEIIIDKRTTKPEKKEPEIDRKEKRRLEREAKMLEDAKKASLKDTKEPKKTKEQIKAEKKEAEKAALEALEPAWTYAGLLPPWAGEGTLIWAKVWGFPWWPALINAPEESPGSTRLRKPVKAENIWVFNLGAGNFSEVGPAKCILPYTNDNTVKFGMLDKMKPNLKKDLRKAMKAADDIIGVEGAKITGGHGQPIAPNLEILEANHAANPPAKKSKKK